MDQIIRDRVVRFRIDGGNRELLQRAAEAAGLSLSVWCRLRLFACARGELDEGRGAAIGVDTKEADFRPEVAQASLRKPISKASPERPRARPDPDKIAAAQGWLSKKK